MVILQVRDPEMLERVLRVNEMAQENWEQYVAHEVTNMKGHLVPYPIKGTEMALLNRILATKYFLMWVTAS